MKNFILIIAVFAISAAFAGNTFAQSDKEIADAVIKMTKGQWATENANPGKATNENIAEDYTEFNQDFPVRLESRAQANMFYEAMGTDGSSSKASEMANVKVQVYNGDTAILTYNYIGVIKDKDGKTAPSLAKSTRVYVKTGGSWKLVHANFAPVTLRDN